MNQNRLAAAALSALLALSALSCAADNTDTPAASDDTMPPDSTAAATAADSTDRADTPDSLPALDFNGEAVRFTLRDNYNFTLNEMVGELDGDVVHDAIYARNRGIEERLNVKLDMILGDQNAYTFMQNLKTVLLAADDAYDVLVTTQYLSTPWVSENLFRDLADAPYLDYEKPWWNNAYMDEIAVNPEHRYLICGDITMSQLRVAGVMYFNKNLFAEVFDDADLLYRQVLDGTWTYDALRGYIRDGYRDINGNGEEDPDDILGMMMHTVANADHFSYTAGLHFTERDSDRIPYISEDQTRNVEIMETLYSLYYETPGAYIWTDIANYTEIAKKFNNCTSLFLPELLMISEDLRDMEDEFGIVPLPKLDETQESYLALVHDTGSLLAIPCTREDLELPCAVLEAMAADNYRTVMPAYYETALKVKYTRDEMSAHVIDIIHDNMITEFVYANNYVFGSTTIGTIARTLLGSASKNYMSTYETMEKNVSKIIADMVEAEQNQ